MRSHHLRQKLPYNQSFATYVPFYLSSCGPSQKQTHGESNLQRTSLQERRSPSIMESSISSLGSACVHPAKWCRPLLMNLSLSCTRHGILTPPHPLNQWTVKGPKKELGQNAKMQLSTCNKTVAALSYVRHSSCYLPSPSPQLTSISCF